MLSLIYDIMEKHWKKLMLITIIALLLSFGVLVNNFLSTGYFIQRDIELSGGKMITIATRDHVDIARVENTLSDYDANIRFTTGATMNNLLIETKTDVDENEIIDKLDFVNVEDYNTKVIGPALGELFWNQTIIAIGMALVMLAIVIFALYRNPVPCFTIILSTTTDIIVTLAVMSLLGINLSLATLGALLMMIGYSVDTDILLDTRLLKEKKGEKEGIKSAMRTGLTMTATTLVALIVLYFMSETIIFKEIAAVLLIGLTVDLPSTWLTNVGILRLWLEKQRGSQ